MMKKYKAFGEKMMYGKKVLGVIRSTVWIGPDGVVKKHWAKVPEAAAHPAKVLEALLA
jgi:peroxiredoxin Q/BCP